MTQLEKINFLEKRKIYFSTWQKILIDEYENELNNIGKKNILLETWLNVIFVTFIYLSFHNL